MSFVTRRITSRVRATRALSWLWLVLVVAAGCSAGAGERRGAAVDADTLATAAIAEESLAASATVFGPSVGFRSRQRLDEHFAKHGGEFGAITRAVYLRHAQRLRDAPVGGDILELRRGDGTLARFDRASGAFLAFDDDGIIRTYFKPNDGERYFRRQARRRAGS